VTPRWERTPDALFFNGPLYMDAVLRPHRSLSAAMLICVIVINVVGALIFIDNGAFPVAGSLGLDVLALWLAFRFNYRAAQLAEYVRIVPGRAHVAAIYKNGVATHWQLNPIWAKFMREGPGVLIRDGEGQIRLGAFLSPKECESLAVALDAALHRARRGGI
jgi:uncharacterized membrane protein